MGRKPADLAVHPARPRARSELPQAVTLGGINANISRAGGPAIGGLIIAAAWRVLVLAAGFRWRLVEGEGLDLSASLRWQEPAVVVGVEPEEGPILVTVEYRVNPRA